MNIAVLVLLLAPPSQVLLNEVVEIPASQWRFAAVTPGSPPTRLECDYRVLSGGSAVRVVLMDREEFKQWNGGDRELLLSAEPAPRGVFARLVHTADEYAVVLANGGAKGPVRVALRVTEHRLSVSQLSTARRVTVIAISISVFLAIVIYSARKLRSAMGNG